MTFSMLIEQILLYSTNKQRDISMANFITKELNQVFGWVDHKLKEKLAKQNDEGLAWRICVATSIALVD